MGKIFGIVIVCFVVIYFIFFLDFLLSTSDILQIAITSILNVIMFKGYEKNKQQRWASVWVKCSVRISYDIFTHLTKIFIVNAIHAIQYNDSTVNITHKHTHIFSHFALQIVPLDEIDVWPGSMNYIIQTTAL